MSDLANAPHDHDHIPDCLAGCLVCGKTLVNFQDKGNQPSGGVEFETVGNYGSAVIDCQSGKMLINICDPCLVKAIAAGRVMKETSPLPSVSPPRRVRKWTAGD